ncbi:unnamed protein product, partial [Pylaiella littoralis]
LLARTTKERDEGVCRSRGATHGDHVWSRRAERSLASSRGFAEAAADAAEGASKNQGSGRCETRVCAAQGRDLKGKRRSGRSQVKNQRGVRGRSRGGGGFDGSGGSGRCWCSRGERMVPQGLRFRGGHQEKTQWHPHARRVRAQCFGSRGLSGGFDVVVEGVAVSGPLETPGDIRVAMEHDWRFADIGGLIDDPKEAPAVKALLQSHLPALSHVHASRSGGRTGAAAGSASTRMPQMMSFHDLGHAFHRYGIMSFAEDTNAGAGERKKENDNDDDESKNNTAAAVATPTRKVFENANRGNWPGDGKVLCRAQFLSALVLVARDKGDAGIVEALREIVEETLLPMHAEATDDEVGVEIARTEVQRFISDNRRLLQAVYLLYAEPSVDGALISLQNFRELMDDCGVMSAMTATTSGRVKFDFLAETCFLQVQGNPPLPSLVFTEFIEAACRLAIMTAEDSSSNQVPPGAPNEANGGSPRQNSSVDTIYLVLDCIIDLGLGDKGLGDRD